MTMPLEQKHALNRAYQEDWLEHGYPIYKDIEYRCPHCESVIGHGTEEIGREQVGDEPGTTPRVKEIRYDHAPKMG